MGENMPSKVVEELHKKYDALLLKILALPAIQDQIVELKKDVEWNLEHEWGDYEFEVNALENFSIGAKNMLGVSEIWEDVKETVRDEVNWATVNVDEFINRGMYLKIEDITLTRLEQIEDALFDALKRKHGKAKK
jgi:hypothetical protein